jgi:hypothetical protein
VWVDLPVDVYIDGLTHRCRVVDVSLSGMVLELPPALALQRPYLFGTYTIHAGRTPPLRVAARTVWRRGVMQASRFISMPHLERATLGELVERAQRRAGEATRLEMAERKDRKLGERKGHRH